MSCYFMLFTVFWRPVGFSTYIFGGGPLFPPTRARVKRARALAEIGPRTWTPKQGGDTPGSHNKEPQQGATTRSHNEEPQRGATTGSHYRPRPISLTPSLLKTKGMKKKLMKSYD